VRRQKINPVRTWKNHMRKVKRREFNIRRAILRAAPTMPTLVTRPGMHHPVPDNSETIKILTELIQKKMEELDQSFTRAMTHPEMIKPPM